MSARNCRPVISRIFEIHAWLGGGACLSSAELVERLEVSKRTLERDLDQLRDTLHVPLEYDARRRGYRYTRPYSLPRASLSAGELTVLLIGQRLLAEMAGTPFAGAARQVVDKLPLLLGQEVSVDLEPLQRDHVSFGVPELRGDEQDLGRRFDLLSEALAEGCTVRMDYYTVSRDVHSRREVDPYHLHWKDGAWYLIGYCHTREEIRIFALDRMENLDRTEGRYQRPGDFDVNEYLGHSWSMERGEQERLVRIAFDRVQARWIRERIWMEGQEIEEQADGGLVLAFRASGLGAVKRWVLGFGRHAAVLEPEELRRAVKEEVEMTAGVYGG